MYRHHLTNSNDPLNCLSLSTGLLLVGFCLSVLAVRRNIKRPYWNSTSPQTSGRLVYVPRSISHSPRFAPVEGNFTPLMQSRTITVKFTLHFKSSTILESRKITP
ncbi:uncharacterized protein ARMOST_06907 [Armillaria ostoyae]|uniref:Uncharacterized protein n=1 Tax=Armillaria ostoyae TaxID=47428 RepID=A0A284R4A0_ARMOS|nr:uncharacterized protein ARMOST_06907 [Armillaria ostoyae]